MKNHCKRFAFTAAAFGLVSVCGLAWQNFSDKIGMTHAQLDGIVKNAVARQEPNFTPSVPKQIVAAYKALPEAEKAAVVKELIAAAKAIVLSPAVLTMQDRRIQSQYGGVNHNMQLPTRIEASNKLSAQRRAKQISDEKYREETAKLNGAGAAADIYRFDASSLRSSLEGDLRSAEYIASKGTRSSSSPDPAKVLEMTKAVAAKSKGDDEAFRRAYAALASFKAGGPADEATVMQLVKEEQQRIYDEYAPKAMLKRGLQEFIQNAARVNFAAGTTTKGNTIVFTDPAMERSPDSIKYLFRLGKAPTAVAVEAAKEILKGL